MQRPWAAYTFAACCAVVLYLTLSHLSVVGGWISSLWKLLSPVVIGIIVAYLLNPISDFFEFKVLKRIKKQETAHFLSVVLTAVCFVLFLGVLLYALIPSLVESVVKLVSNWSSYAESLDGLLQKLIVFAESKNVKIDVNSISDLMEKALDKLMELAKNNAKGIMDTIGNIGAGISNFVIGVVFGFCFLFAERTLVGILNKVRSALFNRERIERNNELFGRFHKVFIRYVGFTLLDSIIMGVGTLIFMLIMRYPYAGLIAVVVGVTNIIPTIGPMIGSVIAIFFLILDEPIYALWYFIFSCIWQSIDGMIIKPRLFGKSAGIPAVWTLVLIILGGKLAGMLGILLAIPFAAILVILYHETIEPRINQRIEKINAEAAAQEQSPPPEAQDEIPTN